MDLLSFSPFENEDANTLLQLGVGVVAASVVCKAVSWITSDPAPEVASTFKWDPATSHGGLLVGQVLKIHGVTHVFTLCGGHISPILVGCKTAGIRVVDVRDEANAAFAADGVSRLTGIPGVCAVTAGPGLTNTITAVKNAQVAQSPLVILGGATSDLLKGRQSLQDIDQFALLKPHCKYLAHVNSVTDIVPMLEKAFQKAVSGTPGPVFIEFPADTIYSKPWLDNAMKKMIPPGEGLVSSTVKWYFDILKKMIPPGV